MSFNIPKILCVDDEPRNLTLLKAMQEAEDEDALMRRVDSALHQTRHEGRNRVVAACDAPLARMYNV